MAAHADLDWFRGEDVLVTFTPQVVRDITGWTISCAIKPTLDSALPVLTVPCTVTTPAAGIFTMAVSASQNTSTLGSGYYVFAIERTDSGSVAVLVEGAIQIKPSAKLA